MTQDASKQTSLWRKARTPIFSAIRHDIWGRVHQEFVDDFLRAAKAFGRQLRTKPPERAALSEDFDAMARRYGYTNEMLKRALVHCLRMHWAMYVIACAAFLYSYWLLLNSTWVSASATLAFAIGAFVHGYLYAYRAWQLRNRRLLRLRNALRDINTYLIL